MTATDAATDVVADVAEEVADNAQQFADVARDASGRGLAFAFGAFLAGAGISGGVTWLLAKRTLEAKYSQIADDEIESMRQHYQEKGKALELQAAKGDLEELVAERGYSSPDAEISDRPPMAVTPPESVVEGTKEALKDARPDAAKVVKEPQEHGEVVKNVFEEHSETVGDDTTWNYAEERKKRSPDRPYVIHYDERDEFEGYEVITLTYYEGDDVLCNDRDEIIDPQADRDRLVGEKNLERFGHGSEDPNVVYVRNDTLELVYEVVKSPNSYAEEVHGIRHDGYNRRNLERMRAREREMSDDDA